MDKFYRWIAKHKRAAFILFSAVLCSIYTFLFVLLKLPVWITVTVDLFLILATWGYTATAYARLMNKALNELLNKCDPFPALNEAQTLMTYKINGADEQILLINYCVALRNIGEYQKVYDTLTSINIDKYPAMLPVNKIIYYNNLSDICTLLGDYEQATLWYAKMFQLFGDLKNDKQRRSLESVMLLATAWDHYRHQRYSDAMMLLNRITPKDSTQQLDNDLLYAKCCIETNDLLQAKDRLVRIIAQGNRLYTVTEARELLKMHQLDSAQ